MKLRNLLFVCSFSLLTSSLIAQTLTLDSPIRFLALGDSYTIGQSVATDGRWPNQLSDSLNVLGYTVEQTEIIATTGWTTTNLLNAIDGAGLEAENYNLVSLLIGVNNQYQGQPFNIYEPEFTQLMDSCLAYVGGDPSKVFVVSIPDYAFTPFGQNNPDPDQISTAIDLYNAANESITNSYGIAYFNITPISRMGVDQPELVAQDGLHPSAAQYTLWVSQILEFIDEQPTATSMASKKLVTTTVFPNPTNDTLVVRFQEEQQVDSWEVYDTTGKLQLSLLGGTQNQFEIPIRMISAGTYFLTGIAEGKLVTREIFVIQE